MPKGAWRVSTFRTFTEKSIKFATCRPTSRMEIRNIKQYLLAALYNAPLTIENYYAAQIDHDLCGGKR